MNFSLTFGKRHFSISTGVKKSAPVADRGPASMRDVGQRMFATAQTSRLTADWPVSITSADAEIFTSAIAVRSRLRQMDRDDDYFRGMLTLWENNIIGDLGIRLDLKCRGDDKKLDIALNESIQDSWDDYQDQDNCTVMRNLDGIQLQRLGARALARDGVILFRKRGPWSDPPFRNSFNFALEPIESDRLDHFWNQPAVGTGNEIRFGLELDAYKAVVAYWILTRHPGDVFDGSSPRYRERVPADEIIPIWTIERAGQSIGMPLWPSIAKRLHNLGGYEESEQIAARAGSCKGGWFERVPGVAGADEYTGPTDEQGNKIVDTAPGQWEELPLGLKAVINDPKHPTDQFVHFVKSQLRGAAAGSGIPYNSVAQDLESVNYSSYKAGRNDAHDVFKYSQGLLTRKLMRPWFRAWLPYAILSGKIPGLTISDEGRVIRCDNWKPRRWAGLEPLKEVQANVLSVEAGFDSRRNIIKEDYDRTVEEVDDEQEHDNQSAKDHDLDFSSQDIKKPVVGAGPSDTGTAPEGSQQAGGTSSEGRKNGNGHGMTKEALDEMREELRAQRYDFRDFIGRKAQPVPPITLNVENKPATLKRTIKTSRDEVGNLVLEETRE